MASTKGTPRALTRHEARAIDERAIEGLGMSGLVLMENAGRSAAEWLHQHAAAGPLVILGGLGNNGGDGWVLARHWECLRGERAQLFVVAPPEVEVAGRMSRDARANYRILELAGNAIHPLRTGDDAELAAACATAATIVDAVLGTGSQGALRPPLPQIFAMVNAAKAMRVAIDIPSGLDCDTGKASPGCFRADHTLSFVAPKIGFAEVQAAEWTGTVHCLSIGLPHNFFDIV
jgi:NAD(P)H-hydrate epimerase